MGKKHLSLIIIPHSRSRSRTFSLSKRAVKTAAWAGIIGAVLLAAVVADYIRIQATRQTYRALLAENQKQKETLQQYENSLGELEKKIRGFDDYTKKLNLLAGLREPGIVQGYDGLGGEGIVPNAGQIGPPSQVELSPQNIQAIQSKTEDLQKNLSTLVNFFENRAAVLASRPSIWPARGWLSSQFGWRIDPFTRLRTFHNGFDIAAPFGSPVVAPADGFVAQINKDKIFGNSIVLSHGGGITTLYGHLSKVVVRPGQKIKRGDKIGEVGSTGKSLAPHLHYEVHVNGKAVNPYWYILEEQ
jgi:murein DD-endopeptidase MepM/ murein hydrolase activator NlpD